MLRQHLFQPNSWKKLQTQQTPQSRYNEEVRVMNSIREKLRKDNALIKKPTKEIQS